jgi:phosphotransferase system  glucose/maltose/N-acetylglucosamine-specific IIC component
MNGFQRFCAKMEDNTWTLCQRILGVVLGIASCVALFWRGSSDTENAFSWSLIVAIIIAMWVPNIIEKQALRRIPKTRTSMVITMGIIIVIYFLIVFFFPGVIPM